MKCPIDDVELVMTERQGIEIDYCPKCRGVWLDRGELDKIIERTADERPAPPPVYQEQPRIDHGYRQGHAQRQPYAKKRKSLLGEIFDF